MNAKDLKKSIKEMTSHITFDFHGKSCGIDPLSQSEFNVWCGDKMITVGNADEVMNTPIFDEQSLADIIGEIENLDM